MAAGQLAHPAGFVEVIESYQVGGAPFAVVIAAGLITSEVAAAVGLLALERAHRRKAAAGAVGVALAWSALGVQAFARGLALDNCGCFGVYAAQPLRWWVLVEDLELVLLAVWVRRRAGAPRVGDGPTTPAADGRIRSSPVGT